MKRLLNLILVYSCLAVTFSSFELGAQPALVNHTTEGETYQQPEWFNSQRVQLHSRVSTGFYKNPDDSIFGHWAEKVVRKLGANTFTRHIKTDEGPNHWKSEWGAWTSLANTRNIVKEAVEEAHRNNCRMIGYYNHYTDAYLRDNYPAYVCKDPEGNPVVKQGRGTQVCYNSPALDSIQIRLVEFAQMGGDGIYFDEVHMPREGCWCSYCREKFKSLTGKEAPESIDIHSDLYKEYQNFNNQSVVEGFAQWRQALKAVNPEFVLLIGSNTLPKLVDRHLNTDLYQLADAHKTEPEIPMRTLRLVPKGIAAPNAELWRGLSYTFSRDIADGRPAHYWIHGMNNAPVEQAEAITAGIISFGNIANLDLYEPLAPDRNMKAAVDYGNRVSPAFAGTKPLPWLLIYFDEKALEKHLGTEADGWINFLSPFCGAYALAQTQHLPVGVISRSQLEQGFFQGAKVLFLANSNYLTEGMKQQIDAFKQQGGTVIAQQANWKWHLGGAEEAQAGKELSALFAKAASAPVLSTTNGSGFYYVNYFIKQQSDTTRYLASYSNSLEWIVIGAKTKQEGAERAALTKKPNPVSKAVLHVNRTDKPVLVRDVVTGKTLPYVLKKGVMKLDVPQFQNAALIELVYKSKPEKR